MYGYIYKTTNQINGKIYIGQKKSNVFLEEKYLGSGKIFLQALQKYGKSNFKVELIDTADSKDELNKKEIYWIKKFNSRDKSVRYNLSRGGNGGDVLPDKNTELGIKMRKESYDKSRKTLYERTGSYSPNKGKKIVNKNGKYKFIDESELQRYLDEGWILGTRRVCSDETRKLIREKFVMTEKRKIAAQNKRGCVVISNEQLNRQKFVTKEELDTYLKLGWKIGVLEKNRRKASEETRQKLVQSHLGQRGSNTNKILINNASITKYVTKDELELYLNDGWVLGALPFTEIHRKHLSESVKNSPSLVNSKGTKYMHNEDTEKRVAEKEVESYLQNGWVYGRLPVNRIKINKEGKEKNVLPEELDSYLESGWLIGGAKRK